MIREEFKTMNIAYASVYFDKKKNVIIIPTWLDENGIGRGSVKFIKIENTEIETKLGDKILEAIDISLKNEQENKQQKPFMLATGIKSWERFVKKYQLVSVTRFENGQYSIQKMLRKGNAFGLDKDDLPYYSRTVEGPITNQVLGEIVLEMLEI